MTSVNGPSIVHERARHDRHRRKSGRGGLFASAADGHVDCSIDTIGEIRRGQGDEADCPGFVAVLPVEDRTSGGPHRGAIDNHSLTPAGAPTRLVFSNSFVARTGVDGNHRMYMVDVDLPPALWPTTTRSRTRRTARSAWTATGATGPRTPIHDLMMLPSFLVTTTTLGRGGWGSPSGQWLMAVAGRCRRSGPGTGWRRTTCRWSAWDRGPSPRRR